MRLGRWNLSVGQCRYPHSLWLARRKDIGLEVVDDSEHVIAVAGVLHSRRELPVDRPLPEQKRGWTASAKA